jgi:acyl phosphate:glycerol-3-phosphate acyltransferase
MSLEVLLLAVLAGYLIGTIPAAYFVVKRARGLDIRFSGSTNVGATNAFETTGSRRVGITVLLLDALKGVLAVLAGWGVAVLFGEAGALMPPAETFWPKSAALLGALAGHNYNLFLSVTAGKLSGGKGFATAVVGFLFVTPWAVPVWIVLCFIGIQAFERLKGVRDMIPGNVLACSLTPFAALAIYGWPGFVVVGIFGLLALPKHFRQMRALLLTEYGVHPEPAPVKSALGKAKPEH